MENRQVVPFVYTEIEAPSSGLMRIAKGESYGLMNTRGEVTLPPIYSNVYASSEAGLYYMESDKSGESMYGFARRDGYLMTPTKYTSVTSFSKKGQAYTVVSIDGLDGVIDTLR